MSWHSWSWRKCLAETELYLSHNPGAECRPLLYPWGYGGSVGLTGGPLNKCLLPLLDSWPTSRQKEWESVGEWILYTKIKSKATCHTLTVPRIHNANKLHRTHHLMQFKLRYAFQFYNLQGKWTEKAEFFNGSERKRWAGVGLNILRWHTKQTFFPHTHLTAWKWIICLNNSTQDRVIRVWLKAARMRCMKMFIGYRFTNLDQTVADPLLGLAGVEGHVGLCLHGRLVLVDGFLKPKGWMVVGMTILFIELAAVLMYKRSEHDKPPVKIVLVKINKEKLLICIY